MLAFDSERPQKRLRPNVLPCKISYSGSANANLRYWNPGTKTDGSQTAYFRGRKLLGKTVPVPPGYEGVVVQKTDRTIIDVPTSSGFRSRVEDGEDEDEDGDDLDDHRAAPRELKIVEQTGSFDAITIWGHESVPIDADNPYLRGVQEWINFASAIHGEDTFSGTAKNDTPPGT